MSAQQDAPLRTSCILLVTTTPFTVRIAAANDRIRDLLLLVYSMSIYFDASASAMQLSCTGTKS
eukprot:12680395-Ditylum_brightwellii.AAC.1